MQRSARCLAHRIGETWERGDGRLFSGPFEVGKRSIRGNERNKHEADQVKAGRGAVGKTAAICI